MYDVQMKPFLIGLASASFLWILGFFAFSIETKIPNYQDLESRYEIRETSVTGTQNLYDSQSKATILWAPGNPKIKIIGVKEIETGKWEVVLEKLVER